MGVDARHPLYTENLEDWELMRDTYRGERIVKEAGFRYLPPTSGMRADGVESATQPGAQAYDAYRSRAHVPDLVREAVEAAIGVMHQKPPVIELPAALEPMREKATLRNESLEVLLRRINEAQLICGRLGLLVDFPANTRETSPDLQGTDVVRTEGPLPVPVAPYIALYECEQIINWDQGYRDGLGLETLNFLSLDESEFERTDNFEWQFEQKYRVLLLSGDDEANVASGTYQVGVFRDNRTEFTPTALFTPTFRGNALEEIPFTVINSKDIVADPDDPPLAGLARLVMSIYRQDADYKQSLFMQGQDTLVVIGDTANAEEERRVGAGSKLELPAGGDAKFIGVDSKGLEEQRSSIENDKAAAKSKAGQLMDTVSRERESGEALSIRVAARTASLKQIALAGAYGLQNALRHAALWVGANPEEVLVQANLDFVDDNFNPDDLVKLISSKNMGAPISIQSIHDWMRERDITQFELEEELQRIEEEEALGLGSMQQDLPDDEEEDEDDEGDEAGEDE